MKWNYKSVQRELQRELLQWNIREKKSCINEWGTLHHVTTTKNYSIKQTIKWTFHVVENYLVPKESSKNVHPKKFIFHSKQAIPESKSEEIKRTHLVEAWIIIQTRKKMGPKFILKLTKFKVYFECW